MSPVEVEPTTTPDEITRLAKPWVTIVVERPVNLMSYVTYVFQKYFGYSRKKAEKLMLEVHEDGKSVVSPHPRGDGARRAGDARVRPVGHDGQARMSGFARHRRSRRVIANFTGFEADLLRSLASQLVELLRNEAAVPRDDRDLVRGDDGLLRSHDRARRPGPRAAVPDGLPRRRGLRGVPPVHRGHSCATARAAPSHTIIDNLEEAGLPRELDEDGLMIDELDEPEAESWLRSFTDLRLALATRPGSRRATRPSGRDARRRSPRPGPRHLRVGRLPPGDARRGVDRRLSTGPNRHRSLGSC